MLYLAQVQKQTRLFGSGQAKLKLLAVQQSESSWIAVPGKKVIPAEAANNFNAGVLVLALITRNRQVRRIEEAAPKLVSILQNFSRQLEKCKTQEEEIEHEEQSVTFSHHELNSREMEVEARLEQLQQIEEDLERLEVQLQEIQHVRQKLELKRQEIEKTRQELERKPQEKELLQPRPDDAVLGGQNQRFS